MSTIANKEAIKFETYVTMETIVCYKCAIPFAVPSNYKQHLRDTRDAFYCPNGHEQAYTKSTESILKEKLEKQQQQYEERLAFTQKTLDYNKGKRFEAERKVIGQKIQVSKLKNRIKNGVCPCCNKHFTNLESHMKTQHANYNSTPQP